MGKLMNRRKCLRQNSDLSECLLSNVINTVHRQIVHCWKDPLEKKKATLSSIHAEEIPGTEEPRKRVGRDLATKQQQNDHFIKAY